MKYEFVAHWFIFSMPSRLLSSYVEIKRYGHFILIKSFNQSFLDNIHRVFFFFFSCPWPTLNLILNVITQFWHKNIVNTLKPNNFPTWKFRDKTFQQLQHDKFQSNPIRPLNILGLLIIYCWKMSSQNRYKHIKCYISN